MSLLRKAFVVNGAEAFCLIFGLLQSIAINRGLGPDGAGQYGIITACLMLGIQLFGLGFPLAFLYHSKRDPQQSKIYLMNSLWVTFISGMVGGLLVMAIIQKFQGQFGQISLWALGICGAHLVIQLLGVLSRNCLLVDIEAKRLGLVRIISVVGTTGALMILWKLKLLTVNTALLALLIGSLLRAILGWLWTHQRLDFSIKPQVSVIRNMGSMGLRLGASDLVVLLLGQMNLMIIKFYFDGFASVGYYRLGHRISMLLITAGQAVLPLLFSHWSGLEGRKLSDHIEMTLRFASTGALFLIGFLVLLGKPLVVFFYSQKYIPAVVPLMILLPGTGFYLLGRILVHALSSRGLPHLSTYMLLANVIVCAVFSVTLIPVWDIKGAALASTLGHITMFCLLLGATRKHCGIRPRRCFGLTWKQMLNTLRHLRQPSN